MQFVITQSGNCLELSKKSNDQKLVSGHWWISWGRYKAEILDSKDALLYTISRKFHFWQWKMTFTIKDPSGKTYLIEGKNKWHSIYEVVIDESQFEIRIHRKREKSIFKNGIQIALINEPITQAFGSNKTQLLTNNLEDVTLSFVLFFCLHFGNTNDGTLTFDLGNLGEKEPIDRTWKP